MNKNLKQSKGIAIVTYVLLTMSVIVFFVANHYAEFEMDDLWYATNLVTGEPLHSLADVWQSQV